MKKILLACGREKKQFNRLVKEFDRLKGEKLVNADIIAQIGSSNYKPKNFVFVDWLSNKELEQKIIEADLVVGDASPEIVDFSFHHDKPLIVVPRLKRYNETSSDKQLEFARMLEVSGKALKVEDITELSQKIFETRHFIPWLKSERARMIIRITLYIKGEKSKK